ncbi:MAG: HAD-IIB family hydrolase, partial [Streptococcus thermophilus]|nr:HAD-IIB family hydrolase [Streptococcus thermophilus]
MNQNQVKLIAIDMDGTLLNSQKEIPEENIKAIQEATAAGIKIVLCTGRPRSGIVPHFEKLGLSEEEYIIMNNGCSTYETKNWTLLESESLSCSEMEELLQACEDFPGVALTFTGEKSYYVVGNEVPEL